MPDTAAYLGKHIYGTIRDSSYHPVELTGEREGRRGDSNLNGGTRCCETSEEVDADRNQCPYGRAVFDNIQLRKRINERITFSLSFIEGDKKAPKMMAPKRKTTIAAIIHKWIHEHLEN